MEGQGPEHSNAYMERYLAACADDNCRWSTSPRPAQYFHALRRQMKRPFRRPLVVMAPKSLLRKPRGRSRPWTTCVQGPFREVLDDPEPPALRAPDRLVQREGLLRSPPAAQAGQGGGCGARARGTALPLSRGHAGGGGRAVRVGQGGGVGAGRDAEPRRLELHVPAPSGALPRERVRYAGRAPSASPAAGSLAVHKREQEALVRSALERRSAPSERECGFIQDRMRSGAC